MEDHARYVEYYEYQGEEAGHASVVGGEVEPGQVVAVYNERDNEVLASHDDWKKSSKKAFLKQNPDQEDSH